MLARHAPGARVLVEVNLAGEHQKAGCAPDDAAALVDALREAGLDVAGLMTVPPHGDDPRPWFAMLRGLATQLDLTELSMGMTDDFEVAIERGRDDRAHRTRAVRAPWCTMRADRSRARAASCHGSRPAGR